jgi:hypothetical protein
MVEKLVHGLFLAPGSGCGLAQGLAGMTWSPGPRDPVRTAIGDCLRNHRYVALSPKCSNKKSLFNTLLYFSMNRLTPGTGYVPGNPA